jgi:hypothetical protein
MRKTHLIVAAGLLLALSGAANAKGPGSGLGGGGQPSSPPGLSNTTGGHNGFDQETSSAFPNGEPKGWDQGKATWKDDPTDATQPLPPGFNDPKH